MCKPLKTRQKARIPNSKKGWLCIHSDQQLPVRDFFALRINEAFTPFTFWKTIRKRIARTHYGPLRLRRRTPIASSVFFIRGSRLHRSFAISKALHFYRSCFVVVAPRRKGQQRKQRQQKCKSSELHMSMKKQFKCRS